MSERLYALPGTQCDEELWHELIPLLEPHFELVHVPLPEGESLAEIRTHLVEQFPEEPFHLLGFSLGGYLAAFYAAAHPNQIRSLHIVANTPCALNEEELASRQQTLHWLERFTYAGMAHNKVMNMLSEMPHAKHIRTIQAMDKRLGGDHLRQQLMATTKRQDLHTALGEIDTPTHFYAGERDSFVNWDWLSNFLTQNTSATVTAFNTRSHMLPLEFANGLSNALVKNMREEAFTA